MFVFYKKNIKMKRILFSTLVLFTLSLISCKEKASSKIKASNLEKAKERDLAANQFAVAHFEKTVYDFGTIKEGEKVQGTFTIQNKGTTPLVVLSADASCGCTVPKYPKEPILPEKSSELTFIFDSKGRLGKQSKTITLKTNTKEGIITLRLTGVVKS